MYQYHHAPSFLHFFLFTWLILFICSSKRCGNANEHSTIIDVLFTFMNIYRGVTDGWGQTGGGALFRRMCASVFWIIHHMSIFLSELRVLVWENDEINQNCASLFHDKKKTSLFLLNHKKAQLTAHTICVKTRKHKHWLFVWQKKSIDYLTQKKALTIASVHKYYFFYHSI